MSFLDVDALREGSRMPFSEEYSENLSLSLSLSLSRVVDNIVQCSHVLEFKIASKDQI